MKLVYFVSVIAFVVWQDVALSNPIRKVPISWLGILHIYKRANIIKHPIKKVTWITPFHPSDLFSQHIWLWRRTQASNVSYQFILFWQLTSLTFTSISKTFTFSKFSQQLRTGSFGFWLTAFRSTSYPGSFFTRRAPSKEPGYEVAFHLLICSDVSRLSSFPFRYSTHFR